MASLHQAPFSCQLKVPSFQPHLTLPGQLSCSTPLHVGGLSKAAQCMVDPSTATVPGRAFSGPCRVLRWATGAVAAASCNCR